MPHLFLFCAQVRARNFRNTRLARHALRDVNAGILKLTNLFRIDQTFGALNIIDYFDDGMTVVRLVNG